MMNRRDALRSLASTTVGGIAACALDRPFASAAAESGKTVWGIAELFCWLYGKKEPTGHDSEDCLQAHLDVGIRHVMWHLGRSVLDYHSKLPTSTLYVGDDRPESKAIGISFRQRCSLRTGLAFANAQGMTLYGRLAMNRHYGSGYGGGLRSEFAAKHPQWWLVRKTGKSDATRLSYFFPECREERIGILLEAAEIGVHGLCLDFCRQPPMMGYDPQVIDAYKAKGGDDPRSLKAGDPKFLEWCRFRAGCVTQFLREFRPRLAAFEKRTGRKVPVLARITDAGLNVNLMEGVDVHAWLDEKLIDELCTDPLWVWDYAYPDTIAPYVELARSMGIKVYGGVSCLATGGTKTNPVSFLRRIARQYAEGADGIALYQTDMGCVDPVLKPYLPSVANAAAVERGASDKNLLGKWPQDEKHRYRDFGIDNHSRLPIANRARESLDTL